MTCWINQAGGRVLERYKTVLNESETEMAEKKSRFIASVSSIGTEDEARAFIDIVKKKNYNATHNVFAYQIGKRNEIQRFSDDGEPQGTAGKPVLDVLKGEDIKNTVIVVTRYFGGTLLGTGGLVRAYGRAAKEGVHNSGIIEMIPYFLYSIVTDYSLSGKIQYEVLQGNHTIMDTIYTEAVEYIVAVEMEYGDAINKSITELSGGKAVVKAVCEKYGYWKDNILILS